MPFTDKVISRAGISVATAATHEIVAATSGQKILVFAIWLYSSGTVTVTPKSATTALSGPIDLVAQSHFVKDFNYAAEPWFVTTVSEAFNLTLGQAIQVSGVCYYAKS